MEIFIGSALSLVILGFCMGLLFKAIKHKKMLPIVLIFGILAIYFSCIFNSHFFNIFSSSLLIPQLAFLLYVIVYFILSVKNRRKNIIKVTNEKLPHVSFVVAVHNEENVVEKSVHNLLKMDYPSDLYDITFIDDFSTDNTVDLLNNYKDKINFVDRSLSKKSSIIKGKPAAINDIIHSLKGELICTLDADSLPESDFLKKCIPYFNDQEIGVVQGRNVFYNEKKNFITRLTSLDIYSVQQAMYKPMSSLGFGMFEGRAGIFRKKVFLNVDGFDPDLPGEDYDFSYRVALSNYRIIFDDTICSYEQVTETPYEWLKQRKRWLGNHVLSYFKNCSRLNNSEVLSKRQKMSMSFVIFNLLFFFFFNFYGPLILINELLYSQEYSIIFIASFILIIVLFCLPYIINYKRFRLIILVPLMIIYYWIFTIIETWVFINEKVLGINLFYKKAFHRKPSLYEI